LHPRGIGISGNFPLLKLVISYFQDMENIGQSIQVKIARQQSYRPWLPLLMQALPPFMANSAMLARCMLINWQEQGI